MFRLVIALVAALPFAACATDAVPPVPSSPQAAQLFGPLGPVPASADNPISDAKVALGRTLFAETRLSSDGSLACQSCHRPDQGFTVATPLSPAFPTKSERRNPPSLINVAFRQPLLWDGRVADLDDQPLSTIADRLHFNNDPDLLATEIGRDPEYSQAFIAAFGTEEVTAPRMAQAIASYVRTLTASDSPFDRYMAGDGDALTTSAKRGLALFVGKANCIACHRGPDFSDNNFHNLGIPDEPLQAQPAAFTTLAFDAMRMGIESWKLVKEDLGRELVTKKEEDRGRFRTMSLHNVSRTAPYMHNGALPTLASVVAFYNAGGGSHPNKTELLRPLQLSEEEQGDLVQFLDALTGVPTGQW